MKFETQKIPKPEEPRTGDGRHRTIDVVDPQTLWPEATAPETTTEAPEAKEDKEQTLREIMSWLDGVNSWAEALAKSDMNITKGQKEMMARQIISHTNSIRESLDKLK